MGLGSLLRAVRDDFTENVTDFLNGVNRTFYGEDFYAPAVAYVPPPEPQPDAVPKQKAFCNKDDPYEQPRPKRPIRSRSDSQPVSQSVSDPVLNYFRSQGIEPTKTKVKGLVQHGDKVYGHQNGQLTSYDPRSIQENVLNYQKKVIPGFDFDDQYAYVTGKDGRRQTYLRDDLTGIKTKPIVNSPATLDSRVSMDTPDVDNEIERPDREMIPNLNRLQHIKNNPEFYRADISRQMALIGTPSSDEERDTLKILDQARNYIDRIEQTDDLKSLLSPNLGRNTQSTHAGRPSVLSKPQLEYETAAEVEAARMSGGSKYLTHTDGADNKITNLGTPLVKDTIHNPLEAQKSLSPEQIRVDKLPVLPQMSKGHPEDLKIQHMLGG